MNGLKSRGWILGAALAAGAFGVAACGGTPGSAGDPGGSAHVMGEGGGHSGAMEAGASATTGLTSWAHGHRLVAERVRFPARQQATFAFRIVDGAGRPVQTFGIDQTKRMHLIVVRRDLTGYQHLHPTMTGSGRWSAPLTLRAPGAYRAFADFVIDGRRTVLGVDLQAPGRARPASLRAATSSAKSGGYVIRLARPNGLRAPAEERLAFTVSRAGKPVHDLQPYLGAIGHLVVLRERDLSYQHTHAEHGGQTGAMGPTMEFAAHLPTASRYRAFLQFRAGGALRTVAFTIAARA